MSQSIKISVIVPFFNSEKHLKQCLDSVLNQTLKEIEIICVDDGSKDGSVALVEQYARQDKRIVLLKQANQGPGRSRNKALEQAKGEYVAFVDSDDYMDSTLCEKAYLLAKRQQADVVQFNYTEYRETTQKYKTIDLAKKLKKEYHYNLSKNGFYSKQNIPEGLFHNLYNQVWNRIYRRDFLLSHHIHFSTSHNAEDHLFTIGVLLFAEKIFFLKESLYTYRIRVGSACHTWGKEDITWTYDNIKQLADYLKEQKVYDLYEKEFKRYCVQVLFWVRLKLPAEQITDYDREVARLLSKEDFEAYLRLAGKRSFWQRLCRLGRKK